MTIVKRCEWAPRQNGGGFRLGSPLSPVLFNIYTHDLAKLNSADVRIMTFADDILVHCRGSGTQRVTEKMQPKLDDIQRWCVDNGMDINPDKAKALLLTLNNRLTAPPMPTFGGTSIVQEGSLSYLGVVFDRQLNFSLHVDHTIVRANRGLNALRAAAGRHAEERHLVMLYKALVLSVMDYALPLLQLSASLAGLRDSRTHV